MSAYCSRRAGTSCILLLLAAAAEATTALRLAAPAGFEAKVRPPLASVNGGRTHLPQVQQKY